MRLTNRSRLAFLTGVVCWLEISAIIWGWTHYSNSLRHWAIIPLIGFHAGYMFADRFHRSQIHPSILLLPSMLLLSAGVLFTSPVVTTTALLGVNTTLQAVRRTLKPISNLLVWQKNLAKATGMLCSFFTTFGVVAFTIEISIVTILIVPTFHQVYTSSKHHPVKLPDSFTRKDIRITILETLHHAHYFAYAFVFWILLPPTWLRFLGAMFLLGWLLYFVCESVYSRHQQFQPLIVGIGHFFTAIILILMANTQDPIIILILWTATGLAAGTCYSIGYSSTPQKLREIGEDAGHIIGLSVAALTLYIFEAPTSVLYVAAMLAFLTTIISIQLALKERTNSKKEE